MKNGTPTVLAIESSCDETAVAILVGFDDLRVSLVASQAEIHARYGGVVPEVASRNHLADLPRILREAFAKTNLSASCIDAYAATAGPGLAPALLVGLSHAKGLAIGSRRPFFAVNHMEGHLLSPFFGEPQIPRHLGLIVSGGHTLLVSVNGLSSYQIVGQTCDDAAGEAFDKVAKLLGLPYPGGAIVDELAEHGDPTAFRFPRSMLHSNDANFSFSGLKTSVRYLLEKQPIETERARADLCASFREAVVDVLVTKSLRCLETLGLRTLGVSGGVASNRALKRRFSTLAKPAGLDIRFAPDGMRMDNAAMIAFVAAHRFAASREQGSSGDPIDTDIFPRLDWPTSPPSPA